MSSMWYHDVNFVNLVKPSNLPMQVVVRGLQPLQQQVVQLPVGCQPSSSNRPAASCPRLSDRPVTFCGPQYSMKPGTPPPKGAKVRSQNVLLYIDKENN